MAHICIAFCRDATWKDGSIALIFSGENTFTSLQNQSPSPKVSSEKPLKSSQKARIISHVLTGTSWKGYIHSSVIELSPICVITFCHPSGIRRGTRATSIPIYQTTSLIFHPFTSNDPRYLFLATSASFLAFFSDISLWIYGTIWTRFSSFFQNTTSSSISSSKATFPGVLSARPAGRVNLLGSVGAQASLLRRGIFTPSSVSIVIAATHENNTHGFFHSRRSHTVGIHGAGTLSFNRTNPSSSDIRIVIHSGVISTDDPLKNTLSYNGLESRLPPSSMSCLWIPNSSFLSIWRISQTTRTLRLSRSFLNS